MTLIRCFRTSATTALRPHAVVLLHFCHDLRIGELVGGLNLLHTLKQRLGAAETLLELQLGLTRPED